jgi:hypothetical protein
MRSKGQELEKTWSLIWSELRSSTFQWLVLVRIHYFDQVCYLHVHVDTWYIAKKWMAKEKHRLRFYQLKTWSLDSKTNPLPWQGGKLGMKELWYFVRKRLKRTRTINRLNGKNKKLFFSTLDPCPDEFVTRFASVCKWDFWPELIYIFCEL